MKNGAFGCRRYKDRIGILIAQLGTPDAPDAPALRRYLKEFLGDPRVIEANRAVWWVVLNGIILRTRPKRSAALYKRIWTPEGSPLLKITEGQTEALRGRLAGLDAPIEVEFGMRYGKPSLESALDSLIARGCSKILLFPMYPQYAGATSGSTYDAVFPALLKRRWVPTLRVAEPYFLHPAYLQAQADVINEAYEKLDPRPERLVLSYHGIPEAYVDKGDPYCCMCTETTRGLLPLLKIKPEEVIHTYQSRFGKDPWLVPYTDETIKELAGQGVKNIALACPGFTADCLETLDELGNEGRHLFTEMGGSGYHLIPCLNTHPSWTRAMAEIVGEEIGSWLASSARLAEDCEVACPVKRAKGLKG